MAKRKKYRFTTARNTPYQLKSRAWKKYTDTLRMLSDTASKKLAAYIAEGHTEQEILDYAYALVTKYGEGAAELACEMYDALAAYSNALVEPAVPAATATYGETARTIRGEMKRTDRVDVISSAAGRLVKTVSADTMMMNALRDGAEWAWIPRGDTCAFCLTLASRGWQEASADALKNGHAEHIHNNCDCNYCVRLDNNVTVEGYDPDLYLSMYNSAPGGSPKNKINALRREFYAKNKETINEQKRSAYAKRTALNSSSAEEINISAIKDFENVHWKDASETGLLIKKDGSHISLGGEEHNVIGDKNLLGEMDGATFSHNHPSNTTFSTTDIANGIARGNLREMRAVTSSGDIHILKNDGASAENRRKFNALYSEAEKKFTRIANEKYRRGELTDVAAYINERKEKWLAENAPKYGLEYRKTHR